MTEQQVSKLAATLVEHQARFSELSIEDAQWAIQNTSDAIDLFVTAVKSRAHGDAPQVEKLLELVACASIPALPAFVASDHFKVDTKKAAVRIWRLGDNFKDHFLPKTEHATEALEIKVHKLLSQSVDTSIIAELGEKHKTTLAQFFHLLSRQGKGESGALLVNGYANIAYIRDKIGDLWAVHADWAADNGGWDVGAYSVRRPLRWNDGSQVLSC